jgi:hypothetical protein
MTVQANRVKINLGDKLFVRRFCESPDYVSKVDAQPEFASSGTDINQQNAQVD